MKLTELATRLSGRLHGSELNVESLSIPEAQKSGTICVLSGKKAAELAKGVASAYVVGEDFTAETDKPLIFVKNPRMAVVELINIFLPEKPHKAEISPKASIDPEAKLGENVSVGAFCVFAKNVFVDADCRIASGVTLGEGVKIGKSTIIYPNVTIYDGCTIGSGVIIHAGAVIGSDGFGFIPGEEHTKIPHRGTVVIEDKVEIGANTTIDRATIGNTVVGRGTKVDNLCQIGHNVRIGRGCFIAAQVGIAGSTTIGDYVSLGGQVGLADHLNIGSFTSFAAQSGVHQNAEANSGAYGGYPAISAREWAKQTAALARLPELLKRVRRLEDN